MSEMITQEAAERAADHIYPLINQEYANCISKSLHEAIDENGLNEEKLEKLLKECAKNVYVDRVTVGKAAYYALMLFFAAL